MKTTLMLLTFIFLFQTLESQDFKMKMDRGDTVYYSTKIPANLKDIYGTYKTSRPNGGYAILNANGTGTYRYPGAGFAVPRCPIQDITVTEWGLRCDKKGKIIINKANGVDRYIVVMISGEEKKFEACYTNVKEATLFILEPKWLLGADTQWEKQ